VGLGVADVGGEQHVAIITDAIGWAPVKVRLYTAPGSHPGVAAQAMLRRKGIAFKRTDLFPVMSRGILRALGFPRGTVPAMRIDGRRVQGSREISRELDRIQPEPPLFPTDPEKRAAVEEAERFGDEDFQHPVRQIIWWSLRRDGAPLRSYSEGYRLGIPIGLAVKTSAPVVALAARINESTDENVRRDLAELGTMLDRIDGWIADGVIGGEEPNAADFQIAPTLRLAMTMQDLRPLINARPAGEMARRVIPDYPGDAPPILPAAWMAPLREAAPA
jgi:glutathione S-transferase